MHLIKLEKLFKKKTGSAHIEAIFSCNSQHIQAEIKEIRASLKRNEAFHRNHREKLTHAIKTAIRQIESSFPEISEHFGQSNRNGSIHSLFQGYTYTPIISIKWDTGSNYSRTIETSDVQDKQPKICNDNGFLVFENELHKQNSENHGEWNPDDIDSFDPRGDIE
jgi:hypothetical protein